MLFLLVISRMQITTNAQTCSQSLPPAHPPPGKYAIALIYLQHRAMSHTRVCFYKELVQIVSEAFQTQLQSSLLAILNRSLRQNTPLFCVELSASWLNRVHQYLEGTLEFKLTLATSLFTFLRNFLMIITHIIQPGKCVIKQCYNSTFYQAIMSTKLSYMQKIIHQLLFRVVWLCSVLAHQWFLQFSMKYWACGQS